MTDQYSNCVSNIPDSQILFPNLSENCLSDTYDTFVSLSGADDHLFDCRIVNVFPDGGEPTCASLVVIVVWYTIHVAFKLKRFGGGKSEWNVTRFYVGCVGKRGTV